MRGMAASEAQACWKSECMRTLFTRISRPVTNAIVSKVWQKYRSFSAVLALMFASKSACYSIFQIYKRIMFRKCKSHGIALAQTQSHIFKAEKGNDIVRQQIRLGCKNELRKHNSNHSYWLEGPKLEEPFTRVLHVSEWLQESYEIEFSKQSWSSMSLKKLKRSCSSKAA